jgi:membrane-associated phospholipid phosphatase
MLAPSFVDERIPFWAWTVWAYNSQFILLLLAFWKMHKTASLSRTTYAMALASGAAFFIFLAFPTTIPRHHVVDEGPTAMGFAALYALDAPTNCFPSLHVALAWLTASGVASERHTWRGVWLAWAVCVTLATLTTKQHYFVDVIGGAVLAAVCYGILKRAAF